MNASDRLSWQQDSAHISEHSSRYLLIRDLFPDKSYVRSPSLLKTQTRHRTPFLRLPFTIEPIRARLLARKQIAGHPSSVYERWNVFLNYSSKIVLQQSPHLTRNPTGTILALFRAICLRKTRHRVVFIPAKVWLVFLCEDRWRVVAGWVVTLTWVDFFVSCSIVTGKKTNNNHEIPALEVIVMHSLIVVTTDRADTIGGYTILFMQSNTACHLEQSQQRKCIPCTVSFIIIEP